MLLHAGSSALASQDGTAAALFREGAAAQQRGELERAAEAYRRAIALEPRFAEAHANLGAVLARPGRYEEAVAAYGRALAIDPKLKAARLNLGLAHYRAGVLAAAADAFKAVFDADPSLLQGRQLLGLVLVEIGNDDEAIPHLEASTQAAPTKPAVLFALGRAVLAAGRCTSRSGRRAPRRRARRTAVVAPASRARAAARQPPSAGARRVRGGGRAERRLAAAPRQHRRQPPGARRPRRRARGIRDGDAAVRPRWRRPRLSGVDGRAGRAPGGRATPRGAGRGHRGDLAEPRGLLGRILLKQGHTDAAVRHLERRSRRNRATHPGGSSSDRPTSASGSALAAAREFAEARRLKEEEVMRERKSDPDVRPPR